MTYNITQLSDNEQTAIHNQRMDCLVRNNLGRVSKFKMSKDDFKTWLSTMPTKWLESDNRNERILTALNKR